MTHNERWDQNPGFQDYNNQSDKRNTHKNKNQKNYFPQKNNINDRTMISDYYDNNQSINRKHQSKKMPYFSGKNNQGEWHNEANHMYNNLADRQNENYDNKQKRKKKYNYDDNNNNSMSQNSFITENTQIKPSNINQNQSTSNLLNSNVEKKKNVNNPNNHQNQQNNINNLAGNNPNMKNNVVTNSNSGQNQMQEILMMHNNKMNNFGNQHKVNQSYNFGGESGKMIGMNMNNYANNNNPNSQNNMSNNSNGIGMHGNLSNSGIQGINQQNYQKKNNITSTNSLTRVKNSFGSGNINHIDKEDINNNQFAQNACINNSINDNHDSKLHTQDSENNISITISQATENLNDIRGIFL
jgi:hypothetical protein